MQLNSKSDLNSLYTSNKTISIPKHNPSFNLLNHNKVDTVPSYINVIELFNSK